MSYVLDETSYNSPNYTPGSQVASMYGMPRNVTGITLHHWGVDGQTIDGITSYLCRPGGNTSAHFSLQEGLVYCMVSPEDAAWACGSAEGNATTISIECRPEMSNGDLNTLVEFIQWLESVYGSLNIYCHSDWSQTACPGRYANRIDWIVSQVNAGGDPAPSSGSSSGGSAASMEPAIQWMYDRAGQVTYSMDYRNGPNSYDCSSAVYYALQAAGINTSGKVGSTETMFNDLPAWGFDKVAPDGAGNYAFQRGDVVVWGVPGASGGAGGHTMIMLDDSQIIHCNWGYNGITVNDYNTIFYANGSMYESVYRLRAGATSGGTIHNTTHGSWFDMASEQDLRNAVLAVLRSKEFNDIIKSNVHNVLWYEKPGEFQGRTLPQMLQAIDRATWNTKKMTRYLFNQFRIGMPGVMTDGRMGGLVRNLLGYNEARDGQARREEWAADSKRQYDF